MRIVIDMQGCQNDSRYRGIGRYSVGMITGLLDTLQHDHECILLFNGMLTENLSDLLGYFSKYIRSSQIHIWHGVSPTGAYDQINKEKNKISVILREKFLEKLAPDLVFMSTFFDGFGDNTILSIPSDRKYKAIVTSHDLIPLIQSSIYLDTAPDFKSYYLSKLDQFKQADGFLAVSESSQNELIKYLKIDSSKIINTSEGIESKFKSSSPSREKIEKILNLEIKNRKIVLYFGASDDRKNHLKLIKAFSLLNPEAKQQSILVLAGLSGDHHIHKFKSYAERCGLNSNEIVLLQRLTDDEVIDLYSYCYLFAFPSFHEGFGLPALEAMACGAAVIASNTTSLPEVVGDPALTFDPYSALDIKKSLEKFLLNGQLRNSTASYCLERAKTFSWTKSAEIAKSFFENIQQSKISSTPHDIKKLLDQSVDLIVKHNLSKNLPANDKELLSFNLIQNFRANRKKRVYYDVSNLISVEFVTGIQRVTKEIYQQLVKLYQQQFDIIPIKISQHSDQIEDIKNHPFFEKPLKNYSVADINDIRPGDLYINIDLDHAAHTKVHAYENLQRKGCKTHFIVHDLLPLDLGDSFFSDGASAAHFRWLNEVAKANALICVSQSVMRHVDYYLNSVSDVNPNLELGWFHLGGDFSTPSKEKVAHSASKFEAVNFNNPMFFMVGSVEPRKGHLEVIEAMTELWDQGYKGSLVIAGARGWNNELVTELTNSSPYKDKLLFWPEKVSDSDLAYLYSQASALIAASLGEGFGLPLIEAMHYKKAVIARDIPVFREVTKNTAQYFSSTEELKSLILNYNPSFYTADSNLQTWADSAVQLMDVIINSRYPISWKRDQKVKILPISSGHFGTQSGILLHDRIKSSDKPGKAVVGGYFELGCGTHLLNIYGKSYKYQSIDLSIIHFENEKLITLFNKTNISLQSIDYIYDKPELIASLEISVNRNIKNAEIYIDTMADSSFYISSFEIIQKNEIPFIVFDTSHESFTTDVGIKKPQGIYSQNVEGSLLKGGEINLNAGKYAIEISGTSPLTQAIDVSIGYFDEFNTRQIILDFKGLKVTKSEDSIFSKKTFNLNKDIKDAEFFIDVNEDNKLKISEIRLQRI